MLLSVSQTGAFECRRNTKFQKEILSTTSDIFSTLSGVENVGFKPQLIEKRERVIKIKSVQQQIGLIVSRPTFKWIYIYIYIYIYIHIYILLDVKLYSFVHSSRCKAINETTMVRFRRDLHSSSRETKPFFFVAWHFNNRKRCILYTSWTFYGHYILKLL